MDRLKFALLGLVTATAVFAGWTWSRPDAPEVGACRSIALESAADSESAAVSTTSFDAAAELESEPLAPEPEVTTPEVEDPAADESWPRLIGAPETILRPELAQRLRGFELFFEIDPDFIGRTVFLDVANKPIQVTSSKAIELAQEVVRLALERRDMIEIFAIDYVEEHEVEFHDDFDGAQRDSEALANGLVREFNHGWAAADLRGLYESEEYQLLVQDRSEVLRQLDAKTMAFRILDPLELKGH